MSRAQSEQKTNFFIELDLITRGERDGLATEKLSNCGLPTQQSPKRPQERFDRKTEKRRKNMRPALPAFSDDNSQNQTVDNRGGVL